MNWAAILIEHVLPLALAAGAGALLGGRRRAITDAADNATDQALAAKLERDRVPLSDPFNDEPTKPGRPLQ